METPPKKELSIAAIIALIGGALILAATIALVSASWGTFSNAARVSILSAPVVALYIAGFLTRSKADFEEVSTISLVTACLAFPFALGFAIFQLSNATEVDGSFIALVSGISFLWLLAMEFACKIRQISLFTFTAIASWIVATTSTLPNAPYFSDIAFIIVGLATLFGIHTVVPLDGDRKQLRSYLILGSLSVFSTVFTLRDNISETLPYADVLVVDVLSILAYAVLGLLGVLVAVHAAKMWKSTGERLYGELRVVTENSLLLLASIPSFLIAFASGLEESAPQVLLALLISGAALGFATRLRLKGSASVAWVLVGALTIQLVLIAFSAIEVSWPILVLIVGGLLFALAFFLSSRQGKQSKKSTSDSEVAMTTHLWDLGEPLPVVGQPGGPNATVTEVTRPDGSKATFISTQKTKAEHYLTVFILQGIIFLIVVRVILPAVLGIW
jgi:uncharacterized membrane protein YuzA (DUF378 family)